MPVLRLQFARGEGRRAGRRVRRRADRRPRVRAAVDLGPQGRLGVLRRRDAEPLLRRRRSTGCSPASARACRSRRTPRSRWRRIPGRSSARSSPGFAPAGINRLSLGIQSFDPKHLRALGRVHDADEARRAAEAALAIFGNVNFDLMYALPRQTVAEAEADLAAALAFAPPHLSFYHLTLEPNTLFHRYPPPLPDEETAADIEDAVARDARRGRLPALRDVRACASRARMPAQSQLLAVRRLPRHRRRRALEAVVRRPHRPPGALQAAEAVSGAGRRGRAAAGGRRRGARGRRLRVHAERAAADRRRSGVAVRRAHRAIRWRSCGAGSRRPRRAG